MSQYHRWLTGSSGSSQLHRMTTGPPPVVFVSAADLCAQVRSRAEPAAIDIAERDLAAARVHPHACSTVGDKALLPTAVPRAPF
jgi:hypothetical protein